LVQDGAIGRPVVHLQGNAAEVRPKIAMHDKHGNGGPLVDGWCHFVDIMRIVFGADPVRVYARGFIFAKGHPSLESIRDLAIDTASATVDFGSGDLMATTWSWGMPKGVRVPLLGETLLGPEGAIRMGQRAITLIGEGGEETAVACERVPSPDATAALARDLTQWARGNGQSDVTGEEALIALKTSLAALQSIETGQPVDIAH
jgi:predicted dehydrogenase